MPAVRIRPPRPPDGMTLGWGVYAWMIENLVHGITGEPLELNDESLEFILSHYALKDDGSWLYKKSAMRRARGTGKSPLGAAMAAAELCGPVRFNGWDARDIHGNLLGMPEPAPWIQIVATSLEQTKPVMLVAQSVFSDEAVDRYGLEIAKEQILKTVGPKGRLAAVSNSARRMRGPRPSFVIADEVSEWVSSNGGHEAMVRIDSNLNKHPQGWSRLLELCNAYIPEEDSHAERTHETYLKNMEKLGRSSILYDSLEADPALDLRDPLQLREAIRQAAGDATLDIEGLANFAEERASVSVFRREHLNQILSSDDSLISAQLYDEMSQNVEPLTKSDPITLGFDGALTGDGTAIVAYRLSDKSFHTLFYQEPDSRDKGWRIDEEMVDETFRAYMETYNVVAAACDVHPFESWVYKWERDYGQKMQAKVSPQGMLIRDNRSDLRNLTFLCETLVNDVESKNVKFFPDSRMRRHWGNARRRLNRHGFSYGKITKSSQYRVDIVAGSMMAYAAAMALAKDFKPNTVRPTRVVRLRA